MSDIDKTTMVARPKSDNPAKVVGYYYLGKPPTWWEVLLGKRVGREVYDGEIDALYAGSNSLLAEATKTAGWTHNAELRASAAILHRLALKLKGKL